MLLARQSSSPERGRVKCIKCGETALRSPLRAVGLWFATRKGGLGLGLAICRHIVEEHGGSIAIHSDGPGQGTAVTVEIPLIEAPGPLVAVSRVMK